MENRVPLDRSWSERGSGYRLSLGRRCPCSLLRENLLSPGEILEEEFLRPLNMTQKQLADHLGCDVKVVNRIVIWLNAQQAVDIYRAKKRIRKTPEPLIQIG